MNIKRILQIAILITITQNLYSQDKIITKDSTVLNCKIISQTDSLVICEHINSEDSLSNLIVDTIFLKNILNIKYATKQINTTKIIHKEVIADFEKPHKKKKKLIFGFAINPAISIPTEQQFSIDKKETGYSVAGTFIDLNTYVLFSTKGFGLCLDIGQFTNTQDIFAVAGDLLESYQKDNIYFKIQTGGWRYYYSFAGFTYSKPVFKKRLYLNFSILAGGVYLSEPSLYFKILDKNFTNITENIPVYSLSYGFQPKFSVEYHLRKNLFFKFHANMIISKHKFNSTINITENSNIQTIDNNYSKMTIATNIGIGLSFKFNHEKH